MTESVDISAKFDRSARLQRRLHELVPGGAHTYARGPDQYPEHMTPILTHGDGAHVWDVDGNRYVEYGMGLRSVTLGHGYRPVAEAVTEAVRRGTNFSRPTLLEVEAAEDFLSLVPGADMVKFAKNGSDATTAAVRLARAATGRDHIAVCDHPFFSVDDWFIGSVPMSAGIPQAVQRLTLSFRYNDLASAQALFDQHPGQIACLVLELERTEPPAGDFLHALKRLCHANGALLIADEIVTGFRWHLKGAQHCFDLSPDLSTFGKAMGNGFSVAALVGRREIMELGGLSHNRERVFLLSTTYGAETHTLAATLATIETYEREGVIEVLYRQGERLRAGVQRAIDAHGLAGYFELSGRPCNLLYATRDEGRRPSQAFRTLFLQETIRRGLLMPSMVVSFAHNDAAIDATVARVGEALYIYRRALDEGVEKYLEGRPVKPVFRQYN